MLLRSSKIEGMLTYDGEEKHLRKFDYDGLYGSDTGPWTTSMFIEAAYKTLKREKR